MKYATRWQDVKSITPFSGVQEFFRSFPAKKILLTWETDTGLQDAKINALGIRPFFDEIVICYSNEEKKQHLEHIKNKYSSDEVCVVGDRIDAEIQYGNELGMKTVRLKYGKYKEMMPQHELQQAHHTITEFSQLQSVLRNVATVSRTNKGVLQ